MKKNNQPSINAELTQDHSLGGFNGNSGFNNKYVASRRCWAVKYTDNTGYRATVCFKRKIDAVAVYEWMIAAKWNGAGDYEGAFLNWARENRHLVAYTFKGEL